MFGTYPNNFISEIFSRARDVADLYNRLHFRVHGFRSVRSFELDSVKSLIEIMFPPAALYGDGSFDNGNWISVLFGKAGFL